VNSGQCIRGRIRRREKGIVVAGNGNGGGQ